MNKDYNQILGVENNASLEKIVAAYRLHHLNNFKISLNKKDKTPEDKNRDNEIREAYKFLIEKFNTKRKDPINKFAAEILNLPSITYMGSRYFMRAEECVNEIKSCIDSFANAHESDMKSGYHSLREYHNNDDLEFNRTLVISIAPIKDAIIVFLKNEKIEIDYLKGVIKKHNSQLQTAKKFSDAGGHMSLRFEYLHECYEKVGKRIVELGYLLVNIEKIEEYI